jgi:hypothetical protein
VINIDGLPPVTRADGTISAMSLRCRPVLRWANVEIKLLSEENPAVEI